MKDNDKKTNDINEMEDLDLDDLNGSEDFGDLDELDDDNNKGALIKAVVMIIVLLVILSGILIGILISKKQSKNEPSVQDDIKQYSEDTKTDLPVAEDIEDKEETVFEREENLSTIPPLPTEEPDEIETPAPDGPVMDEPKNKDYSKIKFDIKRNLSEMEAYFKEENDEAISDLAHLDRYIAMSYSLKDTTDYYYYGDVDSNNEPNGKGIAVYTDNEYYCGEWSHGVRSGAGRWIHYHIHNSENKNDIIAFHQFQGTFANDLPNGAGQDHYEYNLDLLKDGVYYVTNYICSYKDGYIDGEIYATTTDKKGAYFDWIGNAESGSFKYISESRDPNKKGPVMSDRENPDNYFWLSEAENKKIGVKNYISENKQ